jgi:hypothetical protein
MANFLSKIRIVSLGILIATLAFGFAIQIPRVQLLALRTWAIPQLEQALDLELTIRQCTIDFWNRSVSLKDLCIKNENQKLLCTEKLAIQWEQTGIIPRWEHLNSVELDRTSIQLYNANSWLKQLGSDRRDEINADPAASPFDFRIRHFNIAQLESENEDGVAFIIDVAYFQDVAIGNIHGQIPLKRCEGLAMVPVISNSTKQRLELEISDVHGILESHNGQWSLASLSAITSAFSTEIQQQSDELEWSIQAHLADSIDFAAFGLSAYTTKVLQAAIEQHENPELNGRLWIDSSAKMTHSLLSISGLPTLGTFSDSLRFAMDSTGNWTSSGAVAIRWKALEEILEPWNVQKDIPFIKTWSNQNLSSSFRWTIGPLEQNISFALPLEQETDMQWSVTCNEPWIPQTIKGSFRNYHLVELPFQGKDWSGDLLATLDSPKTRIELNAFSNAGEAMHLAAVASNALNLSNGQQIDATWKVLSTVMPMNGQWGLSIRDSSWNFQGVSQLTGIQSLGLAPSGEWSLFATLNTRANGTNNGHWTGVLETRNINLLEGKRPIAFDRFDAIAEQNAEFINFEWHSDLTNGHVTVSNDLGHWEQWIHSTLHAQSQSTPAPFIDLEGSLVNFKPIGLITGAPFDLASTSKFSASNVSNGLVLTAQIPSISSQSIVGNDLNLSWNAKETPTFDVNVSAIMNEDSQLVSDLQLSLTMGDLWNGVLAWKNGGDSENAHIAFNLPAADQAIGALRITEFQWPLFGQNLELSAPEELFQWNLNPEQSIALRSRPMVLQSADCRIDVQASLGAGGKWLADLGISLDGDAKSWRGLWNGTSFSNAHGRVIAESNGIKNNAEITFGAKHLEWKGEQLSNLAFSGSGWKDSFEFEALTNWGDGDITGSGTFGQLDLPFLRADWEIRAIEIFGVNQLLPENTVALQGELGGKIQTIWNPSDFKIAGQIHTDSMVTFIPAIGMEYALTADIDLEPGIIRINQGNITDRLGGEARLNGTAYHDRFRSWNLDFGIDATAEPIQFMNLPPEEDAFFFGKAIGTGDINIAGFGDQLWLEANLSADEGTDFSLPLDAVSDENYASFIRFNTAENTPQKLTNSGSFSNVILDLGIDITSNAVARIIFNQSTGEEITGRTQGHLDLRVDDFEEIALNGSLEITQGTYYFTLQNLINKNFNIIPGGTIEWFGDPYAAQIDLLTSYQTRAKLNPLLPDESNLPGRVPVELLLALNGDLLQPEIGFNIQIPEADSRLEALIQGALLNEEEVQRQAISLLVINQFVDQDPLASALGGFQAEGKSSAFIANQLGHWISQISPGVDLGLDYASDDLSGEQELALALSTQLFDDRLRIEGAVGAQTMGQMSSDDIQIQDVTISYDLDVKGQYQVTGHSKSNPSMVNSLDGSSSQGVGIRIRHEFDHWGDWRKSRKRTREE